MDKMPLIALLLNFFPESVILVSLGMALLAEKIRTPPAMQVEKNFKKILCCLEGHRKGLIFMK